VVRQHLTGYSPQRAYNAPTQTKAGGVASSIVHGFCRVDLVAVVGRNALISELSRGLELQIFVRRRVRNPRSDRERPGVSIAAEKVEVQSPSLPRAEGAGWGGYMKAPEAP